MSHLTAHNKKAIERDIHVHAKTNGNPGNISGCLVIYTRLMTPKLPLEQCTLTPIDNVHVFILATTQLLKTENVFNQLPLKSEV